MLQEGESISKTEELFAGMTSSEATALLFEHWNFNDIFINVIRGSAEPYLAQREYQSFCEAVDVVKTCVNVQDPLTDKSFKASKLKALQYGFKVDKYIKTVERILLQREKENF